MLTLFEFITQPLLINLLPLLLILPVSMITTVIFFDHLNHYFKH